MTTYFKNIIAQIDDHEIFVMSAALAYTTALTLAPFVLIILALMSLLNPSLQKEFSAEFTSLFGREVGDAVQAILTNVDQHPQLSSFSGIVGFLILIISASAIFTQLRIALDKINGYTSVTIKNSMINFLKHKFWTVGLVLGFAFLSIASFLVTAFISVLYPNNEGFFWHSLSNLINFLLFSTLFAAIYHFIPSDRLSWRRCFFSGIVSTFFYLVGKSLISLYLGKAGLGSPYGAAGSLIVLLAWVYYTALTLLLSYEISTSAFKKSEINTSI